MNIESLLFACGMAGIFITCILYVAFGQITVRRLRKNLKTKNVLGIEFASGWDIINVAQALSIPRSWSRKLEGSPLSLLYADSEILLQNTTKLDRVLGAVFYWLLTVSGLMMISLMMFSAFGYFN